MVAARPRHAPHATTQGAGSRRAPLQRQASRRTLVSLVGLRRHPWDRAQQCPPPNTSRAHLWRPLCRVLRRRLHRRDPPIRQLGDPVGKGLAWGGGGGTRGERGRRSHLPFLMPPAMWGPPALHEPSCNVASSMNMCHGVRRSRPSPHCRGPYVVATARRRTARASLVQTRHVGPIHACLLACTATSCGRVTHPLCTCSRSCGRATPAPTSAGWSAATPRAPPRSGWPCRMAGWCGGGNQRGDGSVSVVVVVVGGGSASGEPAPAPCLPAAGASGGGGDGIPQRTPGSCEAHVDAPLVRHEADATGAALRAHRGKECHVFLTALPGEHVQGEHVGRRGQGRWHSGWAATAISGVSSTSGTLPRQQPCLEAINGVDVHQLGCLFPQGGLEQPAQQRHLHGGTGAGGPDECCR